MIRVNGLWNTILTLECWAYKIPLVLQAEEDYEGDLGKTKIWSFVITQGEGEGEGVGFGGCRSCNDKIYQIPS